MSGLGAEWKGQGGFIFADTRLLQEKASLPPKKQFLG